MGTNDLHLRRLAGEAANIIEKGCKPDLLVLVDGLLIEGTLTHSGAWRTSLANSFPDALDARMVIGIDEHETELEGGDLASPYLYLIETTAGGSKGRTVSKPLRIRVDRISAWTVIDTGQ